MTNTYQPGNVVKMSVLFTNNATPPVPTDPTTIILRVTDPTGVETPYTYALSQVTKDGVGAYSMQLEVLIAGYWNYRWEAEGTVTAATESRFLVSDSSFGNPQ